jgi:O-antigen/teichoic acid export membrane protein
VALAADRNGEHRRALRHRQDIVAQRMTVRTQALRSTVYSSIGIYTEYLLGMVTAILIARRMGPGHYGIYSTLIWFAAMGIVMVNSGVTTGVIKFIADLRGRNEYGQIRPLLVYMRRVQYWHLMAVLSGGVLLLLLARHRLTFDLSLIDGAMLAVSVGVRALYMFNIAIAKGYEAFNTTAIVAMIAAPTNLLLVAVAVVFHASIEWFLVVYMISGAVFYLISTRQAKRLLRPMPEDADLPRALIQRVRRHLRIVSPTVIIGFFISSGVEILFLNQFDTARSAGYFKVAYQLATSIILLVPGVFGAVLLPLMSKALSQGGPSGGRKFVAATRYLMLLAAPVVAFCACFAAPTIGLLFGNAYAAAAPVFALIVFATAVSTVAQGASSFLVSADRQHLILALMIVFGILKILLDVVLIMHFGLHGAVTAVIIVTLLNAVAYVALAMHIADTPMEWRRLAGILLATLIASVVAAPMLVTGLMPFWALLAGGILILLVYVPSTLLLRCWNQDDIEQMQGLHRKLLMGRPRALAWLLTHAREQAAKGSP